MHEFDGKWFWYGKGGRKRFIKLWQTMFDYFTRDRELGNLIWVLCHSKRAKAGWNPGKPYHDLAGADRYRRGIHKSLFRKVQAIHGEAVPVPCHECGTIPDPDRCVEKQVMWSWWMLWHSRHLKQHDPEALKRAYHHDRVITRDELPDIMAYSGSTMP